jgi:hypothetical protein
MLENSHSTIVEYRIILFRFSSLFATEPRYGFAVGLGSLQLDATMQTFGLFHGTCSLDQLPEIGTWCDYVVLEENDVLTLGEV